MNNIQVHFWSNGTNVYTKIRRKKIDASRPVAPLLRATGGRFLYPGPKALTTVGRTSLQTLPAGAVWVSCATAVKRKRLKCRRSVVKTERGGMSFSNSPERNRPHAWLRQRRRRH